MADQTGTGSRKLTAGVSRSAGRFAPVAIVTLLIALAIGLAVLLPGDEDALEVPPGVSVDIGAPKPTDGLSPTPELPPQTPEIIVGDALQPDEKTLYAVNPDGTGLQALYEHGVFVTIAVSPDERQIAIGSYDQDHRARFSIIDSLTGAASVDLEWDGVVRVQSWSPDGKRVLVWQRTDDETRNSLELYSIAEGTLQDLEVSRVQSTVWSASGDWLYGTLLSDGDATLHRIDPDRPETVEELPVSGYSSLSLSPDGAQLATGSFVPVGDETNYRIDVMSADGSDARELITLPGTTFGVFGLTWSPDSTNLAYSWLAVGGPGVRAETGTYVIDVATGETVRVTGPTEVGDGIETGGRWSLDGGHLLVRRAVCVSCDGVGSKFLVVPVDGSGEVGLPGADEFHYAAAAWDPGGGRFAYSADALYVSNAAGTDVTKIVDLPQTAYVPVAWAAGRVLFVAGPHLPPISYVLDVESGTLEAIDQPDVFEFSPLAFAPDGETYIAFTSEGRLAIVRDGEDLPGEYAEVYSNQQMGHLYNGNGTAAWSPDSTRVAIAVAGSEVGGLTIIDANGDALRYPGELTEGLRWSPDGTRLAYAAEGAIWVLDARGSVPRRVALTSSDAFAWSPDGREIAFFAESRVQAVVVDGGDERDLFRPAWDTPAVTALGWSPDGSRIAVGSFEGLVVGSAESGVIETTIAGAVTGLAWAADGSLAVSMNQSAVSQDRLPGVYVLSPDGSTMSLLARSQSRLFTVEGLLADGRILFVSKYTL